MIVGKFGKEGGGWSLGVSKEGYGVDFWKAIKKNWEVFKSRICFVVENGRRIKFWLDKWCGDTLQKESFTTLFSITNSKDSLVADKWEQNGNLGHWHPCFSRQFHDLELETDAFL